MSNFWATYDSIWLTVLLPSSLINSIILIYLCAARPLPPKLKPYVLPPFMIVAGAFIVLFTASGIRHYLRDRSYDNDSDRDGESDGEIHQAGTGGIATEIDGRNSCRSSGEPKIVNIEGRGNQTSPRLTPV